MKVFSNPGYFWKISIFLLPFIGATLISITRLEDYRHFPGDVIAGGLLGLIISILMYRQYFPSLFSQDPALAFNLPHPYCKQILKIKEKKKKPTTEIPVQDVTEATSGT